MGRRGLHPGAVARTTPEARRGRALAERLALRLPGLARRLAGLVLRLPSSRARTALIAYAYRRTYAAYNRRDWEVNTLLIDSRSYELRGGGLTRLMPDAASVYRGVDGYLEATQLLTEGWRAFAAVRYEGFIELDPGRMFVALILFVGEGERSGVRLEQSAADLQGFRDGMIVSQEYFWDRAAGLEAAGVEPSRWSRSRARR